MYAYVSFAINCVCVCELDMRTVQLLRQVCAEAAAQINSATDRTAAVQAIGSKLEMLYFDQKPTQVWYLLEVTYSLLMPAHTSMMEELWEFQVSDNRSASLHPSIK